MSDAEDVAQEFFSENTRSQFLLRLDQNQGRFRSYLLASVRNRFLNVRMRSAAQKRDGNSETISTDEPIAEQQFREVNAPTLDPSQAYELSWALTLLKRTRDRLVAEQTAKGLLAEFDRFEPFLSAPPSEGEYALLATEMQISTNRVAVSIHRLGRRYRDPLREEVAHTVAEPGEIDEELSICWKFCRDNRNLFCEAASLVCQTCPSRCPSRALVAEAPCTALLSGGSVRAAC